MANYLYQIFAMCSIQIATEQFLLMMYNTIITTIPILIFALNDFDIQSKNLIEKPALLKNFKRRYWPNFFSLGFNIFIGIYQAVLIFFFLYAILAHGVFGPGTQISDMYTFQTLLSVLMIFVTIARCLINSFVWNRFNAIALLLTIVVVVLCVVFGNYSGLFGPGILNQLSHLYSSVSFFVFTVVTCVCCLLPEFLVRQMMRLWFPDA